MTELKPCPFCGGEASKRLFYKGKYRVHCNVCDAHSGDVCDTEAEAIAAWNTRAERTCNDKNGFDETIGFECTVCETTVDCYMQTTTCDKRKQFNYCPNCGAKVVGE